MGAPLVKTTYSQFFYIRQYCHLTLKFPLNIQAMCWALSLNWGQQHTNTMALLHTRNQGRGFKGIFVGYLCLNLLFLQLLKLVYYMGRVFWGKLGYFWGKMVMVEFNCHFCWEIIRFL